MKTKEDSNMKSGLKIKRDKFLKLNSRMQEEEGQAQNLDLMVLFKMRTKEYILIQEGTREDNPKEILVSLKGDLGMFKHLKLEE